MSCSKNHDVNKPRMVGWEDSTLPAVECPVPACDEQTSPHGKDIFCLCMPLLGPDPRLFPITACVWETHLIVCCLILAVQVWTAPLFCLCPCVSVSTLTVFLFSPLWERASGAQQYLRDSKLCRKNTVKSCSKTMLLCGFWTWQSIRIGFVKTFLMSSDLLSLMTQDKEGYCRAPCCVEWAERQSEWFLSSSWTD